MADITKLGPDCDDDDDDGKRGKRGKRGHRGHRGPEGPEGPPGASLGGLIKFSGVVDVDSEGLGLSSFLADTGLGPSGPTPMAALNYPMAIVRNLRNMATNVVISAIAPPAGTISFTLLKNGVPVPGFVITYGAGETGVKSVVTGPVAFAIGDTFDLEATTTAFAVGVSIDVSATIGVE